MTENREDLAAKKFKCSTKERALFEAGIKMGTIYHQFVGVPLDQDSVDALEDAIEKGVLVQPYVESVKVEIDRSIFSPKRDEYSYRSLSGEMLDVILVIKIDNIRVKAEMRYDPVLKYPLMYISNMEESS
ncbi:MAG: dihydroneopterin aldolase family protein [Methanomassiliicoccaceae archaeon]|nr:dihydroneopterin aldolase family protein [Methanomassiliicoccaceae archaeon]